MMRCLNRLGLILLLGCMVSVSACNRDGGSVGSAKKSDQKELLFYIGITMIRPVSVLVENFKKMHPDENLKILLVQGGSQDLYDSIIQSRRGDLYLPGSLSYRKKNIKDDFLKDTQFVGYNRAAILVKKGNPKHVSADLSVFTSKDIRVVLCNPESGSIGRETKNILTKYGNYSEAFDNAVFLSTDSRNLNKTLREDNADVMINWRATAFWDDNKQYLESLPIDEKYAKKKMLVFNLLSTSKYPELAREFMTYAGSEAGRKVFYEYGFLDDDDLKNFDRIVVE